MIASYFGNDSQNVILKTVERTHVVWLNKSLAFAECKDPAIDWIKKRIIMEDGSFEDKTSPELRKHFSSLRLKRASLSYKGICETTTIFPAISDNTDSHDSNDQGNFNNFFQGIIPSGDYFMTFLIPAVIITIMILIAIMLALMLHKKKKAGKLNLFYSETLPPRVPVILQDELLEPPLTNSHPKCSNRAIIDQEETNEFHSFVPKSNMGLQGMSSPRPTPAYYRQT